MSFPQVQTRKQAFLSDYSDVLRKRQNNFDFLRFFGSLLVVISHSFVVAENSLKNDYLSVLTHAPVYLGQLGLVTLFVLGGFLITASYQRNPAPAAFLKNRFLRVMPGFLCVTLLTVFVLGPLLTNLPVWQYISDATTYKYFLNMTMLKWHDALPGLFQNNPAANFVNGSLWTIRYEVYCYFFVLFLGLSKLITKKSVVFLFLLSCITKIIFESPVLNEWTSTGAPHVMKTFFGLYIYFAAGMMFYMLREHITMDIKLFAFALLIVLLPLWVTGIPEFVPVIASAYLVLFLAYTPLLQLQGISQYGDLSYGVYIYSWPIQQTVCQLLGKATTGTTIFLISLPIILIFAFLSWHLVEKRCLNFKRS